MTRSERPQDPRATDRHLLRSAIRGHTAEPERVIYRARPHPSKAIKRIRRRKACVLPVCRSGAVITGMAELARAVARSPGENLGGHVGDAPT